MAFGSSGIWTGVTSVFWEEGICASALDTASFLDGGVEEALSSEAAGSF
jgi:hypothetical protein